MKNTSKTRRIPKAVALTLALVVMIPAFLGAAQKYSPQEEPKLIPRGEYVRQMINQEVVAVVGYRNANISHGDEWMLLEFGVTVFPGHSQRIHRNAFVLETQDGTKIPLATQAEAQADTRAVKALNKRADIQSEPIYYFPVRAQLGCRIGFYADTGKPQNGLPFDEFGTNPESVCLGRLFFRVPDGIEYGRYILHLELAESTLSIPIDIMTKEEAKQAKMEYKEYKQEQKRLAKEENTSAD